MVDSPALVGVVIVVVVATPGSRFVVGVSSRELVESGLGASRAGWHCVLLDLSSLVAIFELAFCCLELS